jgi:hypothetical protein
MAGNNLVGRAQSLTANRSFGTEGVYEIGSIMPQEHVYLKYSGSVSLERFRMVSNNLASANMGVAALGEDILQKDIITINVFDSVTKNLVESFYGCSASSYNTSYRANSIVTESIEMLFLSSSTTANS